MKWIKVAIGAVIAVLSIGIIATTVYKMTQQPSKGIREVSFEIDPEEGKYYPLSAYNEIVEYGVIDEENFNRVTNMVLGYANDIIIDLYFFDVIIRPDNIFFDGDIPSQDGNIYVDSFIDAEGNCTNDGDIFTDNINIKLVFEVPQSPQFTGSSAILILLIPTVFAGSVLLYFYKPFKKD